MPPEFRAGGGGGQVAAWHRKSADGFIRAQPGVAFLLGQIGAGAAEASGVSGWCHRLDSAWSFRFFAIGLKIMHASLKDPSRVVI